VEEISAGGLVVERGELGLRAALIGRLDRRGRLLWSLPKGHIEQGETPELTAVREVAEETGIDCGPGSALHAGLKDWDLENVYEIYPRWLHRYAPGVIRNTEHVFGLCVPDGTPVVLNPREHTGYRWLPWREAADASFSPSNAEAILLLPQFVE
jgi:dihydroneopterin triphosphate diphosphatase